jgi:hypothetical protein
MSLYCSRESLYDAMVNLLVAMTTFHSDLMSLSGVMVSHVEAGQSHLYQYLRWRWFHSSYSSSPATKAAIILQGCVRFSGKTKPPLVPLYSIIPYIYIEYAVLL